MKNGSHCITFIISKVQQGVVFLQTGLGQTLVFFIWKAISSSSLQGILLSSSIIFWLGHLRKIAKNVRAREMSCHPVGSQTRSRAGSARFSVHLATCHLLKIRNECMEEKVISRVYDALTWWRAANLVNLLIVRAADCSHCLTFEMKLNVEGCSMEVMEKVSVPWGYPSSRVLWNDFILNATKILIRC